MLEIKNKKIYGSKEECIVNSLGDILSFGDTKKQLGEGIISLLDGVYAYNEGKIFNLSKIYGAESFSLDELIKIKKELNLNDGYIYVLDAYETYNTYILYTKEELKEIRQIEGTGFNYGSNNIIPTMGYKNIIILAEND